MTIFRNAWGFDNALWRHSTPNFDTIYSGGLEASGGHSWSSLTAGIAVRIHHQNFFVTEVSLQAELPSYFIMRCFIYHHSALHHLLLLAPYQQATINQLLFPSRVVIGFVNVNSQVFSTTLIPVSIRNQPLGQHRRTWLRPSHSHYHKMLSKHNLTDQLQLYNHITSRFICTECSL